MIDTGLKNNNKNEKEELDSHIIHVNVGGISYKIFLPDNDTDYIQKLITEKKAPYEAEFLKYMCKFLKPNDLVLDIGANIGNHTLFLAMTKRCRVYSFEPNQNLLQALHVSIDLNDLKGQVKVYPFALGEFSAKGRFVREIPENIGAQSIELTDEGGIEVYPLDKLDISEKVASIKIDVEGMEFSVLQGGRKLLERDRPLIYIECLEKEDFLNIYTWLRDLNYAYWDTYNATPTHFFIPIERIGEFNRIKDFHCRGVFDYYSKRKELENKKRDINRMSDDYDKIFGDFKMINKTFVLNSNQTLKELNGLKEILIHLKEDQENNKEVFSKNIEIFSKKLSDAEIKGEELRCIIKDKDNVISILEKKNNFLAKDLLEKIKENEKIYSSLTHQLGVHLMAAITSRNGFLKLPKALSSLYFESKRRKNKKIEKFFLDGIKLKIKKWFFKKKERKNNELIEPPVPPTPIGNMDRALSLMPTGAINKMRVSCIMDEFTFNCFRYELDLSQLTPKNWKNELESHKPEMLFIESAWRGKDDLWTGIINKDNAVLRQILEWCKKKSIPTVFWNKEDPVHFHSFKEIESYFDHVFTTDINSIPEYKKFFSHDRVYLLPFACQPVLHNPIELYERKNAISFAGSYYVKYEDRCKSLNGFFDEFLRYKPVDIYDRNFGRNYASYKFPDKYKHRILGNLPFEKIHQSYKGYQYALNLNTITQSQSMFARRAYELLASNTITISNYSRGLKNILGDLVVCTDNPKEATKFISYFDSHAESAEKHKLKGLREVMLHHTYADRVSHVLSKVFGSPYRSYGDKLPHIIVVAYAKDGMEKEKIVEFFRNQNYVNKKLFIVFDKNQHVGLAENENIFYFSTMDELKVSQDLSEDSWISFMDSRDYYGPHYLMDLGLSTFYTSANLIGKSTYFQIKNEEIQVYNPGKSYLFQDSLSLQRAIVKVPFWDKDAFFKDIKTGKEHIIKNSKTLSIDRFNYAHNVPDLFSPEMKEQINSETCTDINSSLDVLKDADSIKLNSPIFFHKNFFDLFKNAKNKNVDINVEEENLVISSRIPKGGHVYIDAEEDISPLSISKNEKINIHLVKKQNLNLRFFVFLLDKNKEKIEHFDMETNKDYLLSVSENAKWIRFSLRIGGPGTAQVKGLFLEKRILGVPVMALKSDTIILTNNYPAYDNIYAYGFLHTRVKEYKKMGKDIDVVRYRHEEDISFEEFEGIDVSTMGEKKLDELLSSGKVKKVLVHVLNPKMWSVLQKHLDHIKVLVWIHAAEIQPYHRREYNWQTKEEIDRAKKLSVNRMKFWKTILFDMHENLHLIFVSKYLLETVMEDLGFRLPETKYSIVHNPIQTRLFEYKKKTVDQRKKILSIRPFASATYANDLTVKTIQILQKKPWFNELDIRIIGDGDLFDETLAPLKGIRNIRLERRFLSQSEISQLHKEYGVFLVPTRMDSQGVSRDEAMSSGLVPVTNAVTAIPEFTDESCAILAPSEDAQAMAEGIVRLYENPDLFLKMSAASAARVRCQSSSEIIIEKEMKMIGESDVL